MNIDPNYLISVPIAFIQIMVCMKIQNVLEGYSYFQKRKPLPISRKQFIFALIFSSLGEFGVGVASLGMCVLGIMWVCQADWGKKPLLPLFKSKGKNNE